MALTTGMLGRFKGMASENDDPLLLVKLDEQNPIYGYLREVADDFFVIQEVKGVNHTDDAIEKTHKTTLALNLVSSFSEIKHREVPRHKRVVARIVYPRRRP